MVSAGEVLFGLYGTSLNSSQGAGVSHAFVKATEHGLECRVVGNGGTVLNVQWGMYIRKSMFTIAKPGNNPNVHWRGNE